MNSIRTLAFVTKSRNRMDSQLRGWPTPAATLHAMVRLAVLSLVLGALAGLAQAQPFQVLHNFGNGTDGANPRAGLIQDASGNLYGTTTGGGANGFGTVFKMNAQGAETVLYSFTLNDGSWPSGNLIQDSAGYLYGTTVNGGDLSCDSYGCGVVFRLSSRGAETALHTFSGGLDGNHPLAGLVLDISGNLYGTTAFGGANGAGTVFSISAQGAESVLYSFTAGVDGRQPYGNLVKDSNGYLYGTTKEGGNFSCFAFGCGVVFRLSPAGTLTVLHSFSSPEGYFPMAGLVFDASGNLYGTTSFDSVAGCGTLFVLSPAGRFGVRHQFTGPDGCDPEAPLIRDAGGNLYGTTLGGGDFNQGTVFVLSANGAYSVLHSFNGTDGALPYGSLLLDRRNGTLYGTTGRGGTYGSGTVFSLRP